MILNYDWSSLYAEKEAGVVHLTGTRYDSAEDVAEAMAAKDRDDGENSRAMAANNNDVHGNEELVGEGGNTGLPTLGREYAGAEADAGGAPQGGAGARRKRTTPLRLQIPIRQWVGGEIQKTLGAHFFDLRTYANFDYRNPPQGPLEWMNLQR